MPLACLPACAAELHALLLQMLSPQQLVEDLQAVLLQAQQRALFLLSDGAQALTLG